MGDVITLSARGRDGAAPLRCRCGCEWFTLGMVGNQVRPPLVTMARGGRITGYQGVPRCAECGKCPEVGDAT